MSLNYSDQCPPLAIALSPLHTGPRLLEGSEFVPCIIVSSLGIATCTGELKEFYQINVLYDYSMGSQDISGF